MINTKKDFFCSFNKMILLFGICITLFLSAKGQESLPAFKINLSNFSKRGIRKHAFQYYIDFSQDSSELVRYFKKPIREYLTLRDDDGVYAEHRIGQMPPGTIQHLRIERTNHSSIMDVFIRFCYEPTFGEKILIENLIFKKGIFFYDMCTPGNNYFLECPDVDSYLHRSHKLINMKTLEIHRITLSHLLILSSKSHCEDKSY